MKKHLALHAVSTGKQSVDELVETVVAINPYVDAIHLREKMRSAKELAEIIKLLDKRCVPLQKVIVNDRADVAFAMGVKGIQLAYHSLPAEIVKGKFSNLTIGKSVHSVEEALLAERQGVDYLLYGHIYPSQSKLNQQPKGISSLREVAKAVSIPVIAIGGISPASVLEIKKTGAKGVAVMSGIFSAEKPEEAAKHYQLLLKNGGEWDE